MLGDFGQTLAARVGTEPRLQLVVLNLAINEPMREVGDGSGNARSDPNDARSTGPMAALVASGVRSGGPRADLRGCGQDGTQCAGCGAADQVD